jgi:hypothetical protein
MNGKRQGDELKFFLTGMPTSTSFDELIRDLRRTPTSFTKRKSAFEAQRRFSRALIAVIHQAQG